MAQLGARFHGMEEVIGSIPIRSTKYLNNLAEPPLKVWQQIGSKFSFAPAAKPCLLSPSSFLKRVASVDCTSIFRMVIAPSPQLRLQRLV